MILNLTIVGLYSYLLGSIPFGLILTNLFLKKDLREIGSGNIGATNVLRTGKKSLAAITLLLDMSKGFLSIFITTMYFDSYVYFSALICLLGHIYPLWLKFKGGKGVATYLGIILALSFDLFIIFGLSWLFFLLLFRYSSLSSIISPIIVFMYSIFLDEHALSIYLFITIIITFYTHRENIFRLKNKTENKIKF